ncbi:MAG TPA: M23 family metallopeptidase [Chitinophagaceae bacterium]|jgi:murein DD-endopeptidase MepM/ murein hydrolase activator NlpD|nr:M23 family metallopeptidase [Chitinophagaceae bacterium]
MLKLFPWLCLFLIGCAASKNPQRKQIKLLQKGIIEDDSSYVYALPYENHTSHLLVQGYFSRFSHKERAALDFKMKRGTKILAARDGVVVRVKEDGNKGGLNKKYRPYGNNIIIQHADGSRAGYWHLQYNGALVNVGDSVKKGQAIALSGKTGYTALPHLHFLVWTFNNNGNWQQVPTHFQTSKGVKYLRPMRKYCSTNQ